jgi:TonB family protein
MKSLSALAVVSAALVSACAGAGTGTPFSMADHATPPALVLSTEPAVQRSFPDRLSPARLPTADRARIAGNVTADLELCVAPDGSVKSVSVDKPSGSDAFDRALADDVPAWRFAPYRAPDGIKVCEQFTVSYLGVNR